MIMAVNRAYYRHKPKNLTKWNYLWINFLFLIVLLDERLFTCPLSKGTMFPNYSNVIAKMLTPSTWLLRLNSVLKLNGHFTIRLNLYKKYVAISCTDTRREKQEKRWLQVPSGPDSLLCCVSKGIKVKIKVRICFIRFCFIWFVNKLRSY